MIQQNNCFLIFEKKHMITISTRGKNMPESPIRKLVPFAEKAKSAGKKIYYLNIGQPDIETPKNVLNALKNSSQRVIEYTHSLGNISFRAKWAEYYQKLSLPVETQDVIITTGGSEALMFAFLSCFNEGDEIIIPEPYYANYNGFATACGINIKTVFCSIERGFELPDMAEFEKIIGPKTKGILICNPGNPTGTVYSKEALQKLSEMVIKHNIWLISDEVYREFCYDGAKHTSVLSFNQSIQHTIVIDSMSKRYSLCGARIGALVTKNKDVINTATKFAQARLSPPTMAQILGEEALNTPQRYIEEVIKNYEERRDVLVNRLNNIPGVFCPKPGGAFYAVASLPVENAEEFCQWLLESFSYHEQTLMMAPASGFYENPTRGKNQVRIAYVLNIHDLNKAMDCLEEGLKQFAAVKENALYKTI